LKLFEYEAKQVYAKYGIPIPQGALATNINQAIQAAAKLKPPLVVKAQVLTGGRGKAGGIRYADSAQDAEKVTASLLDSQVKDFPVLKVLIEEKIDTRKELYLGITIDRYQRSYVLIASAAGGVDIEELAADNPQGIIKFPVNFQTGINSFTASEIAKKIGYSGNQLEQLSEIIQKLYNIVIDSDAELAEINPLAETKAGFVAVDAHMIIDDNALFRHPEYEAKTAELDREQSPQEISASKNGLAYVKLDGDIGVVGNGAGLVMATLDLLSYFGGKAADFLDLGGGATIERITSALQIVLSDAETKAVLVNILGGITHCDDVAKGIVQTLKESALKKPLIVRLMGTNEEEGKRILKNAGIYVLDSMEEAAKRAVETAKEVR
jgi:succinyl-CoA synthetase beta subunit